MKKKTKRKLLLLTFIIIVVLVVLVVIFLFSKKKNINNKLLGSWTTDGVTIYKFNNDNTGVLILPLNNYEFTYIIDDDSLSIDFKDEKSEDSKYAYNYEDDKLILENENGTFTFTRK